MSLLARILLLILLALQLASRKHFIPHTHLDFGWVKTIDQYFNDDVREIHDEVINALEEKVALPDHLRRKFTFNDLAFFKKWLNCNPATRESKIGRVKNLIYKGQLEISGIGFVMADNAGPHYDDIIHNFMAGIRFTESTFQVRSQALMQLDPFGFTHSMAYISHLFGVSDMVLNRIPEMIKNYLQSFKQMRFVWNLPEDRSVNVHLIEHYGWDPMSFESFNPTGPLTSFISVYTYKNKVQTKSEGYEGPAIIMFGDDFSYKFASNQFAHIEGTATQDPDFFYSTWAEYFDDFYESALTLPQFSGDMIPYISKGDHGNRISTIWTGYFTSKPNLKHRIRRIGKLLRTVQLYAGILLAKNPDTAHRDKMIEDFVLLEEMQGAMMHHDTITGTSLISADIDYNERIIEMEKKLNGIFDKIDNKGTYTCDFVGFVSGDDPCHEFIQRRKSGYNSKFYIVSPHAYESTQRITFIVPIAAVRNRVQIMDNVNQFIQTSALCLQKQGFCFLDFQTKLMATPDVNRFFWTFVNDENLFSSIESRFGYPEDALTTKNHSMEKKEEIFVNIEYESMEVGEGVANEQLDVKIVTRKDEVIIETRIDGEAVVTNKIKLLHRKAAMNDPYATHYSARRPWEVLGEFKNVTYYEHVSDMWGALVEGTIADLVIHRPKGADHFEVEVILNWNRELNFFYEVVLSISREDFEEDKFEFWTESNGLFEIQRKQCEVNEKSIFPTTTRASIKNPKTRRGMSVWNDRARGVSVHKNALLLHLQRSGRPEKGQVEIMQVYDRIYTKLLVHNYRIGFEEEYEDKLRVLVDYEPAVFFDKIHSNGNYLGSEFNYLFYAFSANLPTTVKATISHNDPVSFIFRVQNTSRLQKVELALFDYFENWFPQHSVHEVDFQTVTDLGVGDFKRPEPYYELNPLEFKTFYISK